MKVTATTLPRKSASETCAPSCEVNANAGEGAILGEPFLLGGVVGSIMRWRRRHRRHHGECKNEHRPHAQLFSSCFSSLKNRQSVPCAMILLGLDLMMPASRRRKAQNRTVSSDSYSRH